MLLWEFWVYFFFLACLTRPCSTAVSPQWHSESQLISPERRNLAGSTAEAPGGFLAPKATSYLHWEVPA